MGRTKIAVTKHLLAQLLHLPADIAIVTAKECPYDHSVDFVLEGVGVPDADRSRAIVQAFKYEFQPVADKETR